MEMWGYFLRLRWVVGILHVYTGMMLIHTANRMGTGVGGVRGFSVERLRSRCIIAVAAAAWSQISELTRLAAAASAAAKHRALLNGDIRAAGKRSMFCMDVDGDFGKLKKN